MEKKPPRTASSDVSITSINNPQVFWSLAPSGLRDIQKVAYPSTHGPSEASIDVMFARRTSH